MGWRACRARNAGVILRAAVLAGACGLVGCTLSAPAPITTLDADSVARAAPALAPVNASPAPVNGSTFFSQPTTTVPMIQPRGTVGDKRGEKCGYGRACMEQWGDRLPMMLPSAWTPPTGQPGNAACEVSVGGQSGTTTLQSNCDGKGSVAIYLNSADDPGGSSLMATLLYQIETSAAPPVFSGAGGGVHVVFRMAVPEATSGGIAARAATATTPASDGSRAYVVMQSRWCDMTHPPVGNAGPGSGTCLGFGVRVFFLGSSAPSPDSCAFDPNSKYYFCNTAAVPGAPWITLDAGSAVFSGQPWSDMRQFGWTISRAQFSAMLGTMHALHPDVVMSLEPSDWRPVLFGANPEADFSAAPVTLAVAIADTLVTINP